MTFTPIGREQAQAYRVASYLRRTYTFWTADLEVTPRIPYLIWSDHNARVAYYIVCDLWRFPHEA